MAFQLRPNESVSRGLRRLARKQVRNAASALDQPGSDCHAAIHEARRSIKKVRAILEVMAENDAPGVRKEGKRLRKVSRILSPFRDADANIETLEHLHRRVPDSMPEHTFALVHKQLLESRERLMRDRGFGTILEKAVRTLRKSERFMKRPQPSLKFSTLAMAMEVARRNGRQAMVRARSGDRAADFHGWRIAVKTLWCQLSLLEACGNDLQREVRALNELETWLGEDHNVAVLCSRLSNDQIFTPIRGDVDKLWRVSEQYQRELRGKAFIRGNQIYADDGATFIARVTRRWQASRWDHAQDRAA